MARAGTGAAPRTMLFWIHLALGLTAGTAIFTMSVTGALLALQPQILQWLERDQRVVAPDGRSPLPPSAVIDAAVQAAPRIEPASLTLSADPTQAALVSLGRDDIRYVDPYSGTVTGAGAQRSRRFFRAVTEFHRWFAAPAEWRFTARRDRAQVIDAVRVIGVLMGERDRIHAVDARRDQLQSQLGRRVYEQPRAPVALDYGADARSFVTRVGRPADLAVTTDLRHTKARSGAEKGQLHYTVSTFSKFVVPGTSNGTPAVTTTRSPDRANPCFWTAARARRTISS